MSQRVLRTNAVILIGASVLGLPFAFYSLLHGTLLTFILAMLGMAAGVGTLALCQKRQFGHAASGQIYSILAFGLILTVAHPSLTAFGLAITILAPIHAYLLAPAHLRKHPWAMLGVVALCAVFAVTGFRVWPDLASPGVGAVVFCVVAGILTHTAFRLETGFYLQERVQINAYEHLIENIQGVVMRFSREGELLFSAKSAEEFLGCKRYELVGGGLIERIHVLDRPAFMTVFAKANRSGDMSTIEVRMRRDDPTGVRKAPQFVWVEIALSPILDPDRSVSRHEVVALLRDVTDRHDQQDEMAQARRAAEEASEAKSRFLATMGHELRTPLNAIVGFSEMMTGGIGGDLSPVHREYAELIHQSGHHLIDVVRMLLDMSRIEAGKFELQTGPFAPDALIEPCLQMVDVLAREKDVHFVTSISPNLPALVADERACRQVLINLVSNAVKFSHDGGEVLVAIKRQGENLNISITDHGIGMSPDVVGHLGEPFFQAQDGLARRFEGTGLGLSIVKGLVDLHQGSLHAASETGVGTTITVLLPINGPAIKLSDTGTVTPFRVEAEPEPVNPWPEQKRSAI